MKVMNGLVMTLEEDEIFLRLAALLCEQFCQFAKEEVPTYRCIDQVLLNS